MAEIEITLPTVQFGNVKLRATPEELGLESVADTYALGVQAAVLLNLFSQGFKVGGALDVSAPQEATSAPVSGVQGLDEVRAQALLDEGLGGVTEVEYQGTAEGQQAAVEAETTTQSAPWTETVDAPKKPWEDEGW